MNPTVHDDGPDAAEMAISQLQKGVGQAVGYQTVATRQLFDSGADDRGESGNRGLFTRGAI